MRPDEQLAAAQRLQVAADRGPGHAQLGGQAAHVDPAGDADLLEDRVEPLRALHPRTIATPMGTLVTAALSK
ncbi:hypothetical protein GCM10022197_32120 [Microlunatus spumicola]|uniref:Uncharacterized protein n=1 Tax=Microlunatus spumicola TaxID=81499 RepID=A0ABP6XWR0_9ACTN